MSFRFDEREAGFDGIRENVADAIRAHLIRNSGQQIPHLAPADRDFAALNNRK